MSGSAVFSEDGRYRYRLGREIEGLAVNPGMVLFAGLNPSKAGAVKTDPTATRMRKFTEAWGYRRFGIINLFAHVATDPRELLKLDYAEAVGPDNDRHITEAAQEATLIIAAWGSSYPKALARRVGEVLDLLEEAAGAVHHLGMTKNGDPRHPLYLRRDTVPMRWWL